MRGLWDGSDGEGFWEEAVVVGFLEGGGLALLVRCMREGNSMLGQEFQEKAYEALSQMVWLSSQFQQAFLALNLIPELSEVLTREDVDQDHFRFPNGVATAVATLLFALCIHGTRGVGALRESGVMGQLMTFLVEKGPSFGAGASERLLQHLQQTALQTDIETHNLIERLLEKSFEVVDLPSRRYLSRIASLLSLLTDNPPCQASFLEFGGVEKVLVHLNEPLYTDRVMLVSRLIALLVKENAKCARAFCATQALSRLGGILEGSINMAEDNSNVFSVCDAVAWRMAVSKAIDALSEAEDGNKL